MKILVVSESLGGPSHRRGIFHFTRELVRSLAEAGHQLTLLVETTQRYRWLRKQGRRMGLFSAESHVIELLALYRVLDEKVPVIDPSLGPLRRAADWLGRRFRTLSLREFGTCLLRACGILQVRANLIGNKTSQLEYIPADLSYLPLFQTLSLEPGFFNYQSISSLTRLPPPRINARGFDVILVDTPTKAVIERDASARVVCVIHDLLPLTDIRLPDVATQLFLSRLLTSLGQADELAFVSNYTLGRFKDLFPQFAHLPARVVYPRTLFEAPHVGSRSVPSTARPAFVVIVSEDPRKNLSGVIRAFRKMPEADLVVIGRTGKSDLMRDLPSNIRCVGYVSEAEKASLIADAYGLIMPSFAEGFGVPIIEALAANTPVLCSDIPVFREVAGDLADYFDPSSPESICESVMRVSAQQQEWRQRIWERREDLAGRFGHQSQARDFFDQLSLMKAL